MLYKLWKLGEPLVVFIEFLQRLWAWIPLLWRDRDYDQGFLIEMMKFKMLRMANCIEENGLIDAKDRVAKQLRYAAFLCDVMSDGEHIPRVKAMHDAIVAKWGNYVRGPCTPEQAVLTDEVGCMFMREKVSTKEDMQKVHEETLQWAEAWNKAEQDAKKRLLRHIGLYIDQWWD